MFTSFNPVLEMKSMRSLISDVFISAWFEDAEEESFTVLLSFFAVGFNVLFLLIQII
jgi:hypothetical protein